MANQYRHRGRYTDISLSIVARPSRRNRLEETQSISGKSPCLPSLLTFWIRTVRNFENPRNSNFGPISRMPPPRCTRENHYANKCVILHHRLKAVEEDGRKERKTVLKITMLASFATRPHALSNFGNLKGYFFFGTCTEAEHKRVSFWADLPKTGHRRGTWLAGSFPEKLLNR